MKSGGRVWPRAPIWLGLLAVTAGGGLIISCASFERTVNIPPVIEGAQFTGNAACADCHAAYTRAFAASPHGRFHSPHRDRSGQTGCESCHGPGSRHIATGGHGPDKFILNPRRDAAVCLQCHQQTHAEFKLPHHHPVLEGRMHCGQCHDPHGLDIHKSRGALALGRTSESCVGCHREQARPFVFGHQALSEGCGMCHQAHGTFHPKLLGQRDPNLCLKCHAQVQTTAGELVIGSTPHAAFLRRGTCWSAGCHSAVHGSNIDPRLRY